MTGFVALALTAIGVITAFLYYGIHRFSPRKVCERLPKLNAFLTMKWYFDEIYAAIFVRPIVKLAFLCGGIR